MLHLINALIFLIVLWLLCYAVKFFCVNWRIIRVINKFDGPACSSLILGNVDFFMKPTDEIFRLLGAYSKKYYPHFSLRLLHFSGVNILSPEDCEIILGSKKHSTKSRVYEVLITWLGDGLLLSKGEKWLKRRKILTPAFHFSILKDFIAVFNDETEKVINTISQKWKNPIDVVPLATSFSLNTICETAMGHELDPDNIDQEEYKKAIYKIEEIFEYKTMRPWFKYRILNFFSSVCRNESKFLNILHNFTKGIINRKMKDFKSLSGLESLTEQDDDEKGQTYMDRTKRKLAMLDILLHAKLEGNIDYEGICEEVDTFMFEGHDTTAAAIGYCLMLLGNNPDIQDQVYEEIQKVLEGRKQPTYHDLKQMDLLERCIKETLRLYPSVYFISRVIDEDIVLNSGLLVPKDSFVSILICEMHKNESIFPEPAKFDPDRFLPENCKDRHPYAYIPFSAGPRNCIGQKFAMLELKTLISGILQDYKLQAIDTPETIVIKPEILLRTKNGIKVKFIKRFQ